MDAADDADAGPKPDDAADDGTPGPRRKGMDVSHAIRDEARSVVGGVEGRRLASDALCEKARARIRAQATATPPLRWHRKEWQWEPCDSTFEPDVSWVSTVEEEAPASAAGNKRPHAADRPGMTKQAKSQYDQARKRKKNEEELRRGAQGCRDLVQGMANVQRRDDEARASEIVHEGNKLEAKMVRARDKYRRMEGLNVTAGRAAKWADGGGVGMPGIANVGNTCFFNAVFQIVATIPGVDSYMSDSIEPSVKQLIVDLRGAHVGRVCPLGALNDVFERCSDFGRGKQCNASSFLTLVFEVRQLAPHA